MIMDVSASMNIMEGEMSRLDFAKEKALALIKKFRNSDVMIIAAGTPVKTVLPFSRDTEKIVNIIKNLHAEETATDVQEAILRTSPYFRDGDAIYLLSDGAFKGLSSVMKETPGLFFIPVGQKGENAGIQDLEFHKQKDGRYMTVGVVVKNFGRDALQSTLDLFVNKNIVDSQRVEISAGKEKEVYFEQVPAVSGDLKAVLNYPDSFPLDNIRYAVRSLPLTSSILLVTRDNYFLQRFLEQLEGYDLTVMPPDNYQKLSQKNGDKQYDIGIYDNYTPFREMSRQSIYLNPDQDTDWFSLSSGYMKPGELYAFREHPVMRYTDFSWVSIQQARRITSFAGVVLLESDHSPLIITTNRKENNRVVFAFDIRESNFAHSINFPVFFTNLIYWLQSGKENLPEHSINSGETFFRLLPEKFRAAKEAIIRSPDGREWKTPVGKGLLTFPHTYGTGIYRAIFENGAMDFAVNLKKSESDIAPAERIHSNELTGGAPHISFLPSIAIWKIFGILAVSLLAFEERMRRSAV